MITAKETLRTILLCFNRILCNNNIHPSSLSDVRYKIFEDPELTKIIITLFTGKIRGNTSIPKRLQRFIPHLWDSTTEDFATQMEKARSVATENEVKLLLDKQNLNETMEDDLLLKVKISEA